MAMDKYDREVVRKWAAAHEREQFSGTPFYAAARRALTLEDALANLLAHCPDGRAWTSCPLGTAVRVLLEQSYQAWGELEREVYDARVRLQADGAVVPDASRGSTPRSGM